MSRVRAFVDRTRGKVGAAPFVDAGESVFPGVAVVVEVTSCDRGDQLLPNPVQKVWKALKHLEFNSPGPQMKSAQKKNRLRVRQEVDWLASDVCDCTQESCPGCFFPCPKCKSSKCGVVCKLNRDWTYLNVIVTEPDGSSSCNPQQR